MHSLTNENTIASFLLDMRLCVCLRAPISAVVRTLALVRCFPHHARIGADDQESSSTLQGKYMHKREREREQRKFGVYAIWLIPFRDPFSCYYSGIAPITSPPIPLLLQQLPPPQRLPPLRPLECSRHRRHRRTRRRHPCPPKRLRHPFRRARRSPTTTAAARQATAVVATQCSCPIRRRSR